eukprot:SAG31_NODE_13124_length_891_cov_1.103535_1_plen_43_part_10
MTSPSAATDRKLEDGEKCSVLDGLIELYKEKNGKDPEDSDVQK